jgi:uncharacterized protein with GYD domain
MQTFILLTRLSPVAVQQPHALERVEAETMEQIRAHCPGIEWLNNYAVFGPYDYVDIFEAPDIETAAKVSTLVRIYGGAETELWSAVEWPRFKEIVGELLTEKAAGPA